MGISQTFPSYYLLWRMYVPVEVVKVLSLYLEHANLGKDRLPELLGAYIRKLSPTVASSNSRQNMTGLFFSLSASI